MIEPLYGDFDSMPSRYNVREAWVYHRDKNAWEEIHLIAHRKGSYEVGKVDFDFFFPNTPPLPPEAADFSRRCSVRKIAKIASRP